MKRIVVFSMCLLFAGLAMAQEVRRDAISAVTIRGNIGIQKPLTSAQFARSFAGLFEANLAVAVRVSGNLSAGAGFQSTFFKNNEFLQRRITTRATLPYRTSLLCDGVFIRLGYDHFYKTSRFLGFALNGGYLKARYKDVVDNIAVENLPAQPLTFEAPYIQPEFSVNFVMEQRLAFSFFLSQTTILYRYDARAPKLNHFPEIRETGNRLPITYFNFGFGFTVLLGK